MRDTPREPTWSRNTTRFHPGYQGREANYQLEPSSVIISEVDGERYKLFWHYETGTAELYNLTDDLSET